MAENFRVRLSKLQEELKAPKNLYNSFGKYSYRNAEGILEAVKPLLVKYGLVLNVSDDVEVVGERYYIKATAIVRDTESDEIISSSACAREALDKKGMDDSQISGTASSYARKYALNGLFLLDDTKDADTDEYRNQQDRGKKKAEQKTDPAEEEKFEQNAKEIGEMLIAPVKIKSLEDKCKNDGVPVSKILELCKIKSLEEMKEKQYSNIIANWEKVKG